MNANPKEHAAEILRDLLPPIRSRDEALDHLYYVTPAATEQLRLLSIAAALHILRPTE